MLLTDCVERYLLYARAAGLAARSEEHYRTRLRVMVRWLATQGVTETEAVTEDILIAYIAYLRDTRSDATVKATVVVAKSFFNFCQKDFALFPNPALGLKAPPVKLIRKRTFTREDIEALFEQCDVGTAIGARDYAMIALMLDSGIRSIELVNLNTTDLLLADNKAWVKIKGGNMAVAYFSDLTKRAIERWLGFRKEYVPITQRIQPLFIAMGGYTPSERLTTRGLRLRLAYIGEHAGVADVSPHAFRRTFAVFALRAGAPTEIVRRLGRWASLNEVSRYAQALELEGESSKYMPMNWYKSNPDLLARPKLPDVPEMPDTPDNPQTPQLFSKK